MVHSDRIDYDPDSGSGSYSEKQRDAEQPDAEQTISDVGETTFDPTDASPKNRGRYKQLKKRHHEHWNYSGKDKNDRDAAYDHRVVCDRLEVTDVQQERSKKIVDSHRRSGIRYEVVIMAAVSYVLNEDGRWIQRDDDEFGDPLHEVYCDLCESFEVSEDEVKRIRTDVASSIGQRDQSSCDCNNQNMTFSLSDGPSGET